MAVMDSPYALLYAKAKRLSWDPAAIELSRDRDDWEHILLIGREEEYAAQLERLVALSLAGEECVTTMLGAFADAVARGGLGMEKELFVAAQLFEEAKHFEFFARYVRDVFRDEPVDTSDTVLPPLASELATLTTRLRREEEPARLRDLTAQSITLGIGVVESMLARSLYIGMTDALSAHGWLPGLQEGLRMIRRDESRHVSFGMHLLAELCEDNDARRDAVMAALQRHVPQAMAVLHALDAPHPLVDPHRLVALSLEAYAQFTTAAGLTGSAAVRSAELGASLR